MTRGLAFSLLIISSLGVGCRGTPNENPPIHIIRNMDDQPRFEPYEKNEFFEDDSAMRYPVAGTVARGDLPDGPKEIYTGRTSSGSFVAKNPVALSSKVMERGRQRYQIYCTPCHGAVGDGKGIVAQRTLTQGFVPPTNFHSSDMRNKPDGHYFDVITHGIRNMYPYGYQIPVNDRWAIVHYVRALQRSQNASIKDVPSSMLDKVKP